MEIKYINTVRKIHFIMLLVLSVFFSLFSFFIDTSLVFGYVIGACVSYLSFEIRRVYIDSLLRIKKNIFLAILYLFLTLALVGLVLGIILFINYSKGGYKYIMSYPINVFTFCFGITNVQISIVIAHAVTNKNQKGGPWKS
ncbi:hypothetical protein NXS15_03130 [Mycoplasma sp. CSL7475-4]|uniref:hypothetical protein n=1 Tax=Mycoplasma sp. CSL7475-4 TaxID=2973942 RepID=UPI00216AD0A6|nr:hypothetical protein [Mycoplasma sp. CSL7475-4]MCS4537104.1 hypothetical protein [Mycoplasma sp. CSL7475-4]